MNVLSSSMGTSTRFAPVEALCSMICTWALLSSSDMPVQSESSESSWLIPGSCEGILGVSELRVSSGLNFASKCWRNSACRCSSAASV